MRKGTVEALIWQPFELRMLDQRALPHETLYLHYTTAETVAKGIKDMVVRGAPAIGIAAAYGMAIAAHEAASNGLNPRSKLNAAQEVLAASRPTAVNLFWALERCQAVAEKHLNAGGSAKDLAACSPRCLPPPAPSAARCRCRRHPPTEEMNIVSLK